MNVVPIRRRDSPAAVKFADEHGGQQQQQNAIPQAKACRALPSISDVVRHEREIQREKHDPAASPTISAGIAACFPASV